MARQLPSQKEAMVGASTPHWQGGPPVSAQERILTQGGREGGESCPLCHVGSLWASYTVSIT